MRVPDWIWFRWNNWRINRAMRHGEEDWDDGSGRVYRRRTQAERLLIAGVRRMIKHDFERLDR